MPGSAARIRVTERQLKILQDIAHSRTAAVALVQRATLILRAFDKIDNQDIADWQWSSNPGPPEAPMVK